MNWRRVYVVGFAPSVGRDGAGEATVGGFEWRATWPEALNSIHSTMHPEEHDGCDYRITALDVPAHLDGDALTRWLDERPELWEPPSPEYDSDDPDPLAVGQSGILKELCVSGNSRSVCVDPVKARDATWVTTVGEPVRWAGLGAERVHVLTERNRLVTCNVVPCDCA